MKRSRVSIAGASDSDGASDDDAFDDGEDLMARAASMMDFDDEDDSEDEEEDSDSDGSEAESSEAGPSSGKKQKLNNGRQKGKNKKEDALEALPDDDEAELQSVLQLKVCRRDRSHNFARIHRLADRSY